jgi:hypothetical protein
MSYDVNRLFFVAVNEATPGTWLAPTLPTDNTIRTDMDGLPSYDIPKESTGQQADGTFRKGRAWSMTRAISVPDHQYDCIWSGVVTVEPKFFTRMKSMGWNVVDNGGNPRLIWDGNPACSSLSGAVYNRACDGTAVVDSFRGAVGNAAIGAEGPQGAIMVKVTGMMGAFLGKTDVASVDTTLTGADTANVEQMGSYAVLVGGVAYGVQAWEFNPNNEINPEGGNNAEGIERFKVTNQDGQLTMTVTLLDVASDNPLGDHFDNNILSTITLTGGTGAHYDFTATNCDYIDVQPSDAAGTYSYDITLKPETFYADQKA